MSISFEAALAPIRLSDDLVDVFGIARQLLAGQEADAGHDGRLDLGSSGDCNDRVDADGSVRRFIGVGKLSMKVTDFNIERWS